VSSQPISGRTYPLSLRTERYAGWQPLVGILLLAAGMFLLAPLVLLPVLAGGVALDHHGSFSTAFSDAATLKKVTWPGLLYLNLSLAAATPLAIMVLRTVHQVRADWLVSVLPGFRWRFFWACFGLALIAIGAQLGLGALLPGDPAGLHGTVNHFSRESAALAAVIVVSTPLQAIGEEFAFRGYLMQAFGALSRRPWVGILGSAFLFACAHGVQNAPLFLDRFTFGLMAGYVVFRTGGLEAGIAMHIWNNLVAFGLSLFIGDISDTLNVSSVPWSNIALTVTQNGVYLLIVLWLAKRMGLRTTTPEPADLPPPEAGRGPVLLPTTPPV
jgi:membrane protease YdiL (CAAX protease family)